MKPVSAFDNYPPFATNGARTMNTESAKYSVGFVPADTFPAEWANYLFHGATKGVSDLNTAVTSVQTEVQNVITSSGQTPSADDNTQLQTAIMKFINDAVLAANQQILNQAKLDAHPVGSLYWSSDPTNPAELFGGTWTQIKGRFVWAIGDGETVNIEGGERNHTLTANEMPQHSHDIRHKHTRGNMNITGRFSAQVAETWNIKDGAFYKSDESSSCDSGTSGPAYENGFNFDASRTWGGKTSNPVNDSGKEISNSGAVGSSWAHNNMPPFVGKYCWERTA